MLSAIRNNMVSLPQKTQQNQPSAKLQPQLANDTVSFNGYRDVAKRATVELADKASYQMYIRELSGKKTHDIGEGVTVVRDILNDSILIKTPTEELLVHASAGRPKNYYSQSVKAEDGNFFDPDAMTGKIPPNHDSDLEAKIQGYLSKVIDLK